MALALGLLWAWDIYNKALSSHFSKKYKTTALPGTPTYTSNDVSIVVPTIDPDSTFTESVRLWLESKPREVIIVTVLRCKAEIEQLIKPVLTDKIRILTVPFANKRQQITAGAQASSGKIIALVDDDVYWRGNTIVPYLLAPFEDPKIGSAAGLQSPYIPPNRQNPKVITIWEALATLDMFKLDREQPMRFARDGGCWSLVGRTMFVRAEILQDTHFVHAFTHQVVNHTIVNGADDVYVTEWVLDHGWKICVQNAAEAEITTNVKRDWRFALQNLRWERGNMRSFSARLFVSPGFWGLRRRHPYLAREMLEKLTRPLWVIAYLTALHRTMYSTPWLAVSFMIWIILGWASFYRQFARSYPYMSSKVWALVLFELMGPFIDIYAFATMNNDTWLTRAASTQSVLEARTGKASPFLLQVERS